MRLAVLRSCTSVAALGFVLATATVARADAIVLPSGGQVVAGQATIGTGPSQVTVDQTSTNAIVDWRSFSVGAGGTVAFNNGSGATLNRVTGGDMSTIAGTLSATGSVYLINQAGIVIDSGGRVLTGGSFVASTRMMDAASFLSGGDATFSGNSAGGVENRGSITAGGDVVLIGKMVVNSGTINADGTAGLIAADHIVLSAPSSNQRITVDYGDGDVTNSGVIAAATAELRAASGNVFSLAGNNGGIISVVGNATQAGRIWLGASGNVSVSGSLVARNADGSGGTVHVLGHDIVLNADASIDASGIRGGTVLIGGDYKGGIDPDRRYSDLRLPTAATLRFALGATVNVDGGIGGNGTGDGGVAILWSDLDTRVYGSISARGGAEGGDGGFVETSGHEFLDFKASVSTLAAKGKTGTLLLDPTDITISASASSVTGGTTGSAFTTATTTFDPGDRTSSVINTGDLQTAVAANNVTINTSGAGSGTGNITISGALALTGANFLILNAVGSITTSNTISLGGDLTLNAGSNITIGGVISKNDVGATTSTLALNSGASGTTLINAQIGVGHNGTATSRTLNVNINVGQTITNQVVTYASSGALTAGVTASVGNTLTETTRANTITIGGGTTLASTTDGRNTITRNVTAKGNLTITAGATTTAATTTGAGGPPNRNVITLNYFAGGAISHTAGNFSANGLLNGSLAADVRSPVILDWRAGTTLTSSTGSFTTRGGAMSLQTLTASPFDASVTTGGNVSVSGAIATDGGNFTINAAGTTATTVTLTSATTVASAITIGNINVTSAGSITTGGTITGAGTVAAPTNLNFTANGGDLTLGAFAVTTTGSNLNLTATGTITTNGTISSTLGNQTFTSTKVGGTGIAVNAAITTAATQAGNGELRLIAAGSDITIGASTTTAGTGGGSTLISSGGTVTQTAGVNAAAGLRLTGTGNFNLTGSGNNTTTIAGSVTGTGTIAYRQNNALIVGSVTANSATTAGIATGGQTQLSTGGTLTQTAPIVAAGLLATATNQVVLANASNAITGTLALSTTNAAIFLTNTANTSIGSVTGIGGITTVGGVNAGTGFITLSSTGTTSQAVGSSIIGASLQLRGTNGIYLLDSVTNDVNILAADTGLVKFVDADDLSTGQVTSTITINTVTTAATTNGITTTRGSVSGAAATRTDYAVDLMAGAGGGNQFLTIAGTNGNISTGGNGNVRLVADKMAITGTVSTTTAAGRIVRIETATAARGIDFGGNVGDATDTTTLLVDTSELGKITADITHIGSSTAGMLTVLAAFNSTTNTLSLETGSGVNETAGSISVNSGAGNLAIRGVGDINVATQNNQVANVAIFSAGGNVRFRDDNGFVVDTVDGITTSVVSPGGLLQLVTGVAGTVSQAHALTADNLRLGSGAATTGTYTLTNAGNDFLTVAAQAVSASLTETGGFAVGTVDTLTGITATTAATLSSTGAVTQSQIITTPLLTLNGTGGAYTLTGNNQVTALTGNTGSIDFQNTLAGGLTINNTTVATTAKITSNAAGNLVIGTNQTIASSATTGDSVILGTNANFTANTGAAINPGSGTARYLVFTNNVGNATEWTGTTRGSLTGGNFYNAPFDVAGARSAAVGSPNLVSTVTGNRFVYADQPTLLYTIMSALSLPYNGLIQNLPSTFTSGLVNADLIGASASGAAGSTFVASGNAGLYPFLTGTIGTLASPLNYAFSFTGTGTLTVTPAPLTINIASTTKIYGDSDPALTFTVTGLQNGETIGTGLNTAGVSYTATGAAAGTNLTNALTRTAGETVAGGPYAITTGAGLAATPNYTIQTVNNGALTITQRAATIVAVAKTKVYGDADPALTFTVGNLAGGDTATGVTSGALTRVAGETVVTPGPTYQINQGTLALNGNYSLTSYTAANLTITPAPLAISGTGTKVFGQADPVLTITSSGYKLADTQGSVLTGALTRAAGEAAGNYVINQGTVVANGNYAVTYTPGNFSITQAMLMLTYSVANTTNVYGALPTVGAVTLTGVLGSDVVTPVITVTNALAQSVTLASTTGVGTYTATVTSLTGAAAGNYVIANAGNTNGTITVTPAPLVVNVGSGTKIYGDADPAFTFTVTGIQNGEAVGTALNTAGVSYTANGAGGTNITNALTRNGDNNVGGTKVITTGAGLTATSNYTIMTVNPGALTITKRDTSIAAVAKTKVYGDADPALTFTLGNLAAGDTATGVTTGALTRVAGETVIGAGPTYQINQGTLALNGNYNLTTYTAANLTITAAPLTLAATAATKVYGATDPTLAFTTTGLKLTDTVGTVLTGALARAAGETVAGSPYAINQGTLAANGNYAVTYTANTLAITAAPLTIAVTAATKVYGAVDPTLAFTTTGLQAGDTVGAVLTGALARTAGETVAGGPYAINQGTLAASTNYAVTFTGNNLAITTAPLTITVADKTKIYGDADPAFTFTVTGIQNGEAVGTALNTAGVSYTANGAGGTNITNALTRNGDNNVGGTKVITTGAGLTATSNYTIMTVNPGALTITKRDTSIAAVAKTKVYGDADPALTFTLGNLAAGDTATGVTTGALTRVAGETVIGAGPTYQINQGTLALNGNYNLTTYTAANLTITAAPLTLAATAATKVYGATDPTLAFTTTGLKLTDTVGTVLTGALARAAGETVAGSPYAINQGTLAANGNYAVTYTANTLAITAAPLTVAVAAATKVYGDADPVLSFTTTGLQFADTVGSALTGAVIRTAGETVAGGPYAITRGTLAANTNYALTFTGNNLAITPRATAILAGAKTKVYGDADPALTFTLGNLAVGDTVVGVSTGALTRVAGENVAPGPYQINQGTVALNSNYSVASYTPANLTITPAPLAVNAVAATRLYGQADPQLGFLSTGYKFADTATAVLSGTVSRTAGSNVGAYPINQGTVAANTNYAINYTPANLTITPAPLTVTGTGTKIFGQADPVLTPIVTGLVNSDTAGQVLTGALTRNPGENAGMYTINQGTIVSNPNYNLLYVPGTFTINPAGISFAVNYSVANSTSVYGSLPAAGAVTLTGVVGADIVTPVITVTNAQNNPIVLATTTGVGSYTATVTALTGANAGNYILASNGNTNGTITVTPAPLVLTLADKTKIYGDADPALTFTVAGIQNGEAVGTALTGAGTLYTANGAGGTNVSSALSRAAGENVATGPYAISKGAGVAATANYSIQTIVPGALSITAAPLAVTGNATKIYGQPEPVLTVTSTGYKLTDTAGTVLTGALARTPGTNVGTYAITQGSLLANPNYLVTYTPGALAITPATLTYAVGNTTNVYGILPTIGTTVLTGIVTGDTVNPAHTVTNAQNGTVTLATNTNVGTYGAAVTSLTGAAAGNYVLASTGNTNGTITVTPAPLAITGSATKVYGQPDPVLTVTATGFQAGDTAGTVLTGALARTPGTNVGTYAITQGSLLANPNYLVTYTPGALAITPATLTYAVGNTTNVYGILPTIGTTVLTGIVTGDTVNPAHTVTNAQNGTVTLATNTNVGTYGAAVTSLTGAAAGNYVLASTGNTNGTIRVTPATLTVTPSAATKVYGSPDPATLPFTFAGVVGGDPTSILTGVLGRAPGENAGPYNFTNGTLTAGPNYVIALTPPGPVFTITPKPITFAVADTTSVYGTLGTRGAATFTGVLTGDTVTPVYAPVTNSQNGAVTLATNTPVGPYGVTLSGLGGAAGGNYVLATAGNRAGTLTVTRAPLTLVIDNSIRPISTPNPVFTFAFTANGLVGGDTAAALVSQNPADAGANRLAVSSVANMMSPAGMYPIVSTGALANYSLTVVPAVLTVTAPIQPEPPVAPGTSGGSISPTGLNYAGGAATISALVADPGAPKADDSASELVRREDSNKAFNIYIEVVPEAVAQTNSTFGGLGVTEIDGGNNGQADIVSTSSFDPPVANDNPDDDEARRRAAVRPGTGR